ncbi:MAG: alpha/beta hydrolase-fold protein [Actinomycetota bacterium]
MSRAGRYGLALLAFLAVAVPPASAGPGASRARAGDPGSCHRTSKAVPEDLPADGPPALYRPEPALPQPPGWPFGDGFPRTSGTGRYACGAFFWSDFLYDDNGAVGIPSPTMNESVGAPSAGTYVYPDPGQARNGADIFRAAIGRTGAQTWWRVDWSTLVDIHVPVAAFALDTDADPSTGTAAWPGNAGISSPGIDRVILVSGAGAWVIDPASGDRTPVKDIGGAHVVDADARSFLVRIPRSALPPLGDWTVRLAAGLANEAGDGFAQLTPTHGAAPGQPNVYNVTFRRYDEDEPRLRNAWFDTAQATALSLGGDVSAFEATLDWDLVLARESEPEPLVTGYVNRWYVSSQEFDQGIVNGATPTYRGRVQPYMAYVPTDYDPAADPANLTWYLHGAFSNHNSSPAVAPSFLQQLCEERSSICVSPLGRGPSGGWRGQMELDFWEVWNRVATAYRLDPETTILGGVSMGGFGSYHIMLNHPHLFAATYILSGTASTDLPRIGNARWQPIYHFHGALDELVPFPDARETVDQLQALGYRYVFDQYAAEDHVAVQLKDGYRDVADWVGAQGSRKHAPGRITYRWFAGDVEGVNTEYGIAPAGAWWVRDPVIRGAATSAAIEATSLALPEPGVTPTVMTSPRPDAEPSPAIREELTWELGDVPRAESRVDLNLTDVAAMTLRLRGAGIVPSEDAVVSVTTDGTTSLTLTGLSHRQEVFLDGARVSRAHRNGTATVPVPEGTANLITFGSSN